MNQTCKVCGEPAAGFHFGAFTCEGCKSFFGRSYNNLSSISECKNNGKCVIDKKNRTTCKACRLRKCYTVGMSKGGSRYGRRSNWFKIHCLLQEQQQQALDAATAGKVVPGAAAGAYGDMAAAVAAQQQHMQQQQRNSHMVAAQHMGGLLGYPSYLPEMMQTTPPFLSASHHPAEAAAAAALPFFSMMNSLPSIGSPQSAFQLPPHLLFPGYHSGGAAAAAAAADAAYRSEMFKHRQSVDSVASADSHHFSPAARSHCEEERERVPSVAASKSPELCVSGDETDHHHSVASHRSASPPDACSASHTIHSPIAIRATTNALSPIPTSASSANNTPVNEQTLTQIQVPIEVAANATQLLSEETSLAFTTKMQSLSPVSVCSIGAETVAQSSTTTTNTSTPPAAVTTTNDQDCPMDLSMKTSRSSVLSFNTSAAESDVQSDSSEEESRQIAARRKYYHMSSEQEASDFSSDASTNTEAVKRQKLAAVDTAASAQSYTGFGHNATSVRGIFVCV